MAREAELARTLVELADSLVDDFDIVDLLTTLTDRCVSVLGVAAAGIMLLHPDGDLRLMTSSSAAMRVVELFELQAQEGPCLECFRTGEPVVMHDLEHQDRWPEFTAVAVEGGFFAADALPMRLRREVIGALNLFHTDRSALDTPDVIAAQSLADVATIAILQHNATASARSLNSQLTEALNSRIAIEQAKGVVAEHQHIDVDSAFVRLRNYARSHNRLLIDVAADVIAGRLDPASLEAPAPRPHQP